MTERKSPTVRRRRLGLELRRLREQAGLTCEQAGAHLDCSASKVSRIETARVPVRILDVQAMCDLYHATADEIATLGALARESKQRGWWHTFDDVLPGWFQTYVGLEAEATSIRTYEIQLVPGLLQTEGYARAILEAGDLAPITPDDLARALALRMTRQDLLVGPNPPQLWVVLSEAVLVRVVGGPDVMRDQLLYLAELCDRRGITIQVIRNEQGAHPAMNTPFVLLGFPEREDPGVVYIDFLTGGLYLEKPDEVDRYTLTFNHLVAASLPPRQSAQLVRSVAKDH